MSPMGSMATGMAVRVLWLPVLYGIIKIAAGVLVLRYGKAYAEKVKREENKE